MDPRQLTDDDLMARVARDEESAFRLLVERWERPIHAYFWRMTGDGDEARDLAQDVFIKVHAHAGNYRPEGKFKSWLFRIAGNRARSWARRRKIVDWVRFDGFQHDRATNARLPDAALQSEQTGALVRAAVASLPPRQREALVLRRYHEMSQREIADAMDVSEGAVESLLVRAMQTLRQSLARNSEVEA
ncbi:MAG TPA: sigma-70 family RNA polymerase sigma factor [Candidatus Krumholzibacteria bacterium]|nr:sigma-70 family RNA polymerase sigma factor [Candidatus Krumholzibacteria bacterium]HRX50779.1 sigma-70 family RNA polymerase sigma factor [Candidatus Krumholzibacteria bacterium]